MKWKVKLREGRWCIYDSRGNWHDVENSHAEAMDWAYWYALTDQLSAPGGLAAFRRMKDESDWWRAYEKTCDELMVLPPLQPNYKTVMVDGHPMNVDPHFVDRALAAGLTLAEALTCGTCWGPGDDE